jgi:hypothetical protein
MAYTRKYLLQRILKVNEVYKALSVQGITNEFIYEHHIREQFNISRTTFYTYLTVAYDFEIKKIEGAASAQMDLFSLNQESGIKN